MKRTSPHVTIGWKALALLPIAFLAVLLSFVGDRLGLRLKKTVDRTPGDVAGFMGDLIEGSGGQWDWDEFESRPITYPVLENIRLRAVRYGPPNPDKEELRKLIAETEVIAAKRRNI